MYLKHLLSAFMAIICFQVFSQTPYGVYQIPFQTVSPGQSTTIVLGDDQMSGMVPIGFSFSFFGNEYTSLSVSSNGYVTFNQTTAGSSSPFQAAYSIPNAAAPQNAIMLSWCDLNPYLNGNISYGILGEAPNRIFVVQYNLVPLFACNQDLYTGQLQLFEETNNIEVHITAKPLCSNGSGWSNLAIEGIQNASYTEAYTVPGRNNSGSWQAFNDAWRFDPDTTSQPVCVMSGRVVADFNGNCILDGADFNIPGQVIIRDNGLAYSATNNQGAYSFEADTGYYQIAFNGLQSNLPFADIVCPDGASYEVNFETAGSINDQLNFFVHPDSACSDPRINMTPLGPLQRCAGNENHQVISVSNHGLMPITGYTVTLNIPDSLSIINTVPEFTSQSGNTFTWTFTDTLVYGEFTTIHLYDSLSCYATDLTSKCFQASIESMSDCNLTNNQSEVCQIVNGSYDPNHIQLLRTSSNPQFVYELEVEGNETWYTYKVEFQNTGTAPAQTVVVTDLLPDFFNFSTAELLGSSHSCFMVNMGNGTIKFVFNNIALPDSNQSYDESIGNVLFRVKAIQSLLPGQEVANQASIVFDVNDAIITNNAIIRVPIVLGTSEFDNQFSIYPNPADKFIQLMDVSSNANRVCIVDISGKKVLESTLTHSNSQVQIDQLASGVYSVEVYKGLEKLTIKKLIIAHQ